MTTSTNPVSCALACIGIDDAALLDVRSLKDTDAYEWLCFDFDSEQHWSVRITADNVTTISLADVDEITDDGRWKL